MQNDLASVEWREFKVSDIFDVVNSRAYHKTMLESKQGAIPYITRTSFNNGLECCIANTDLQLNPKNTISFGAENADFFYQGKEYVTGNKMYFLQNENINKYSGLFLTRAFQNSIKNCGFGYGKGLTGTRLKNRVLILPIDSKGNPYWKFMETYMRNIEQKQIKKALDYYSKKMLDSQGGGGVNNLDKEELANGAKWKEFEMGEIFTEIKRGKRLIKENHLYGKTPYISSTALNNGVDNFIDNHEGVRRFKNCISLANSGSVGSAFFHSYEFIASDHVTQLLHSKFDKYIYLFFLPIIMRLSEKYSFNREINDKRIRREKLLLPIKSNGSPNYEFMKKYMMSVEKIFLEKVVSYCYSKIGT